MICVKKGDLCKNQALLVLTPLVPNLLYIPVPQHRLLLLLPPHHQIPPIPGPPHRERERESTMVRGYNLLLLLPHTGLLSLHFTHSKEGEERGLQMDHKKHTHSQEREGDVCV